MSGLLPIFPTFLFHEIRNLHEQPFVLADIVRVIHIL